MNDRLLVTIVDACLREGRGGSPTAVLWDGSLSDAERRQVPQSAGASHAVFVSGGDGGVTSLRFFTATGELPACGHGTVAALAFLAAETGRPDYEVMLRAAGRDFAGRAARGEHGALAEFDPGEVQVREARLEEYDGVLAALGRDAESLPAELCLASVGRARLLVPIGDPSALARVRPDSRGTVLDSGGAIAPGSLRLRGSTLTWRHGGATREATLR